MQAFLIFLALGGNGDLNVAGKTIVKADGNLTMTSPSGTKFNCGVTDLGIFSCS